MKKNQLQKYILLEEDECELNGYQFPRTIVSRKWLSDDLKTFWYPRSQVETKLLDGVDPDFNSWHLVPIRKIIFDTGKFFLGLYREELMKNILINVHNYILAEDR